MFEVRIHNFESEKETSHVYNIQSNKKPHILQIIARLNGKLLIFPYCHFTILLFLFSKMVTIHINLIV
jgi:hypothetical protein